MCIGWDVVASLVKEGKGVCVGGFEIGAVFWGEIYGEDIEVMGLAYYRALNFDGDTAWAGPVTHGGVGSEVVGDEHSNAAGVGSGQSGFFMNDGEVVVAMLLDLLFGGGMGFSNTYNIQASGEMIEI